MGAVARRVFTLGIPGQKLVGSGLNVQIVQNMNRRRFIQSGLVTIATLASTGVPRLLSAVSSEPWKFDPDKPIIPAPKDPALWPEFRACLSQWREETRKRLNYDDALYRQPAFTWAASAYACYFLMMCDQAFYDPKGGRYTVESMLDEGAKEFGGYDSLVLWHAYPRIGVDQRNQFDFYRDMPGGLAGLRDVVHALQGRGVRVYIDYNPWDIGTRREDKSDEDMLAEMVRTLDVDGIFLDTMPSGGAGFRAKLDSARPGVILEGEGTPPLEKIADHHASWAQGFDDSEVPGVLRLKWFERRHLQHEIRRWRHDHTGELQTAWMNGSGMMIWENVFGSWVPWNARDRSFLRAILPIQRRYAALFCGEGWTPLVPVEKPAVFASLWTDGELRLWTLVNRANDEVEGTLLRVSTTPGLRYFDLIAGSEIKSDTREKSVELEARIPARGIGCFLAAPPQKLGADFGLFLAAQAAIQLGATGNTTHPRRDVHLVPVAATRKTSIPPAGMVAVRPRQSKIFTITQLRSRECGFYESMTEDLDRETKRPEDIWWWQHEVREFARWIELTPYAIDETPVTNAQYDEFLKATRYRPKHPENFLRHWIAGQLPAGKADHPVVWVDLDDARAFAAWAGKRLPTDEEWQFAARGDSRLQYPWGSGMRAGVCNLGETGDTTPVRAFPDGRSPLGCYDMCGNVWQWTESERNDGRTRFCMIRGGSYFAPEGSIWYVGGGPHEANFAAKFLLLWPGLDRCATIGFRCVVDLET